jgi:hypothetical protein
MKDEGKRMKMLASLRSGLSMPRVMNGRSVGEGAGILCPRN